MKETEAQVLKTICQYLKIRGYFWWRQNNVGVYDQGKKIFRKCQYALPGIPDIFLMRRKHGSKHGDKFYQAQYVYEFIALEVKSANGRQSPEQKEFEEEFKKHGGTYLLARSVYDVQQAGL